MLTQKDSSLPPMPLPLPGFEKVKRYWDTTYDVYLARILPGEYYVTTTGEMITTMLGSCVSACIRDKESGIGGMNHFMLPDTESASGSTLLNASARYGNVAMDHLINTILVHGGRRQNLEVKLFGGGNVLPSMTDVGARNIHFVREYLQKTGLTVTSEDLGDTYPRKILYFPDSGRAMMRKMAISSNQKHVQREMNYQQLLSDTTANSKAG